jgi:hypothetical protein
VIAGSPAIPDGLYTVTLSYRDTIGNAPAGASSGNVRIDTTAPTISPPEDGFTPLVLTLWHYDPAVAAAEAAAASPSQSPSPSPSVPKKGRPKEKETTRENGGRPAGTVGLRKFALTRIAKLEETGRTFPARPFDIRERMKHGMGAFDEDGAALVRLRFTPTIAPYLSERTWHETQQIERQPDGGLELRLHVAHTPELEAFVLRWAGNVEVVEPVALRRRIRELGQELARAHPAG